MNAPHVATVIFLTTAIATSSAFAPLITRSTQSSFSRLRVVNTGTPFTSASSSQKHFSSNVASAAGLPDPSFVRPDTFGSGKISEQSCTDAAMLMQRIMVPVPEYISPGTGMVGISFIHWPADDVAGKKKTLPLLLIHGFDSSCLEYRRLGPKLAAMGIDTYAVDLLGWGFSTMDSNTVKSFSAQAKVDALTSFWDVITNGMDSRVCIAGSSLGGAAAIEFAASSPSVQAAIFISAQGFVDGVGPMAMLPKPLAQLGIKVLKTVALRNMANQMSYFDSKTFATDEAVKIGRLHCLREGWEEALLSFMSSGGFSPSEKVAKIGVPSLVIWGREDGILEKAIADRFVETLPDAELKWIDECGHVPHLEKMEESAAAIELFLRSKKLSGPCLENTAIGSAAYKASLPDAMLRLIGIVSVAAFAGATATAFGSI